MGRDLGSDAVLERRDDLAPRRVVLRIRRKDQGDVEVQAYGVAFDLDVAFLHDVEEAHLNLARQVGQLVDGEDAAIGARQQAEMHRELVRQEMPAPRRLDRIDVPNDVGDRHVRGRELLDEPELARQPGDRRRVAVLGDQLPPVFGDRIEGIIVDLAARDDRNLLVEQRDELAQDTALRLTAQAEQNEIVA